jgi:hypothetical protein
LGGRSDDRGLYQRFELSGTRVAPLPGHGGAGRPNRPDQRFEIPDQQQDAARRSELS